MSRILICWELGGNLGHVMRLLPLARILRVQGHAVTWAFGKTRAAAWQLVTAEGFVCHSIEAENTQPISTALSLTYGQNLLKNGYSLIASPQYTIKPLTPAFEQEIARWSNAGLPSLFQAMRDRHFAVAFAK